MKWFTLATISVVPSHDGEEGEVMVMEKREKEGVFLIAVVIIILTNIFVCFPRELLCSVPSPHLLCAMQVLTS